MTEFQDILLLIGTLIAMAMFFIAYLQIKMSNKIQEIHISLNSRLDALLKSARTEGKQEGKDEANSQK